MCVLRTSEQAGHFQTLRDNQTGCAAVRSESTISQIIADMYEKGRLGTRTSESSVSSDISVAGVVVCVGVGVVAAVDCKKYPGSHQEVCVAMWCGRATTLGSLPPMEVAGGVQ